MCLLRPVPIWFHFHSVWTPSYTIKVTINVSGNEKQSNNKEQGHRLDPRELGAGRREMELMAYTCPIRAKSFPGEGPVSTDALRWLRTGMEMG